MKKLLRCLVLLLVLGGLLGTGIAYAEGAVSGMSIMGGGAPTPPPIGR